jgi:hypothetical protein
MKTTTEQLRQVADGFIVLSAVTTVTRRAFQECHRAMRDMLRTMYKTLSVEQRRRYRSFREGGVPILEAIQLARL